MESSGKDHILNALSSRYELRKKLGEGGMGVVYQAYDKLLDKDVAIKVLRSDLNQEAVIRFQMEAKVTAKLDHPNILRVLDFGESDDGKLYLVMEYIDGTTLASVLEKSGSMPVAQALPIFDQICCGLEHAHANDVLHRDIKPSNIMLIGDSNNYTVKIVDFGLAKLASQDQRLTAKGEHIGSPLYMSPEQARCEAIDQRSDVYSLGALLFTTLKGEPPIKGKTVLETIAQHADPDKTLPRLNDGVKAKQFPVALEEAIELALKKDPEQRCGKVSDLRQLLAKVDDEISVAEREDLAVAQRKHSAGGRRLRARVVLVAIALGVVGFLMLIVSALIDLEQMNPIDSHFFTKSMADFDWLIAKEDLHGNKIKMLRRYTNLQLVKIIDPQFDDSDLPYLANLPIEVLDLTGTNITDEGLKILAQMPALKVLILNNISRISNEGAESIRTMPQLDHVCLRGTRITDGGVAKLAQSRIKGIDIGKVKGITNRSLDYLASAPSLRILRIDENNLKGSDLKKLLRFKNLRHLGVSGLGLTDSDLDPIAELGLFNLDLSNNDISDQGLEKVDPYLLGILDVRHCPRITKEELDSIYERRNLDYIDVSEWPGVVSDFGDYGGKIIAWSRPVQLGDGIEFDPEMFWGRAPLDWLDYKSERVHEFLIARNMVAKKFGKPAVTYVQDRQ